VKIPKDSIERSLLYNELIRQCTVSRMDRFTFYQTLRNYYLFGSMDVAGAPYNKIGASIETLNSFIYSPDTMRFSLHLGTEAPHEDIFKAVPLAYEVTEQWRASKTHIRFGIGARWSQVFGIMLLKVLWNKNRVRSYLVEPHQFGVLREDIIDLEDQEAFTHHYTITNTQLEQQLLGNPRQAMIMARVGSTSGDALPGLSGGLSRLLIGAPVGGVPGSIAIPGQSSSIEGGLGGSGRGPMYDYSPKVEANLIDMCDLYVWNDDEDDYTCVTRAAPDVIIYDRPSNWLGHIKGVPTFTVIRPEFNLYDYFFGGSLVARLAWLQDWRTERIADVRKVMRRQFDPPMSITGGTGIAEEKLLALRTMGGQVSFPTPNAKVEMHAPKMPTDTFSEIAQIDSMFDDAMGLGHVLQGKGEPGVRSRGQADLMARLGSARPKERAIAIEESAEDAAGLILRLVQDHSDQRFTAKGVAAPDGNGDLTFVAEQFTRDYEVKVDAHSSSPIFVEDRKHDAVTLLEAKAIDRETLLDMFDPPNLQDLKERLKKIEKQEAEARQLEMQMQSQSAGGKRK
jgi:hypothetical protein